MKVLFVSSGNRSQDVPPIIRNQGDSVLSAGVEISYFLIHGSGLLGYLSNIIPLRQEIKKNEYDLIHAHYLFTGIIASLTFKKPLVVSLMGSELFSNKFYLSLARLFARYSWSVCIVKSKEMFELLGIKNAIILPNGVDLSRFKPMDKKYCQKELGWDSKKRHVLFASNPERKEKNYELAKSSVELLKENNIVLHTIGNIPNERLVYYYNAADLILLTSKREGSPNVIKEALSCNRPIVSTNVGDVAWVLECLDNCHLTSFEKEDVALVIKNALNNNNLPAGRNRILKLGIDRETVASSLIRMYLQLAQKKYN